MVPSAREKMIGCNTSSNGFAYDLTFSPALPLLLHLSSFTLHPSPLFTTSCLHLPYLIITLPFSIPSGHHSNPALSLSPPESSSPPVVEKIPSHRYHGRSRRTNGGEIYCPADIHVARGLLRCAYPPSSYMRGALVLCRHSPPIRLQAIFDELRSNRWHDCIEDRLSPEVRMMRHANLTAVKPAYHLS